MNSLSLSNNAGWSFNYNGNGSIQVFDNFGIDHGEASSIRLNDLTIEEGEEWLNSSVNEQALLIDQLLVTRFRELGKELSSHRTHQVQCFVHNQKPIVIFEKYGLSGGGPWKLVAGLVGAGKAAFGLIISPANPIIGPALVSSGLSDIGYAVQTPEEKITLKDYGTQTTTSFVSGATTGYIGGKLFAAPAQTLAQKAFSSTATSIGSVTTSTITKAVIKKDVKILNEITPKKIVSNAVTGFVSQELSSFSNNAIESKTMGLLTPVTGVGEIATRTFAGGTSGALTSATMKIGENLISRHTFLQVKYGTEPELKDIEPGKLYVYVKQNQIWYQSINEKRQMRITQISDQGQFRVVSNKDTRFEGFLDILNSNGRKQFSKSQENFILTSAEKHEHVPVGFFNGMADATLTGATTGAVVSLTKATTELQRRSEPVHTRILFDTKKGPLIKRNDFHNKRVIDEDDIQEKRMKLNDGEAAIKRIFSTAPEKIINNQPTLKRALNAHDIQEKRVKIDNTQTVKIVRKIVPQMDETINQPGRLLRGRFIPERTDFRSNGRFRRDLPPKKNAEPLEQQGVLKAPNSSPEEIAAAQNALNKANQQHANIQALATYTSVDMENVATNIYNDARNQGYYSGSQVIPFVEKTLAENYGIPMGTLTDSLKHAYDGRGSHIEQNILNCIESALNVQKHNGLATTYSQQNIDLKVQNYKILTEPQTANFIPPKPYTPPSLNPLTVAMDAENYARNSGYEGNFNVEMRYVAIVLAGADHGDRYNQTYSAILAESYKWQSDPSKEKPTQYGFLTNFIDVQTNGTTTVSVETKKPSFLQDTLGFIGTNGVYVQTNGTNLQVGNLQHHNLVTVYEPKTPQGIEGFQIQKPLSHEQPVTVPIQPTFVSPPLNTATQVNAVNGGGGSTIQQKPTTNTPLLEPSFIQPSETKIQFSQDNFNLTSIGLNTAKVTLTALDTVAEGLGTYASGALDKITTTYSVLGRIDKPEYQNEPGVQQISCAVWGQAVQTTATAFTKPLGPVAEIVVGAVLDQAATKVGDHAQQNCHEVIDMFK